MVIRGHGMKETVNTMDCKNCEYKFKGKFCNICGQSSNVRKVNFKYLLDEIPNSVFQFNRGFLLQLKN